MPPCYREAGQGNQHRQSEADLAPVVWEGSRAVGVGVGISFSRAWAGSTVNKGVDDAGRMEGFVPAGPYLALEENARLGLRIKASARDGLLGVPWAWSFLEFFFCGFWGILAFKGIVMGCGKGEEDW